MAIDISVISLAVCHSYLLGPHARWVLGVRHDKERGARKRKYCSQEGCGNRVQQGGVCVKHGAIVGSQTMQPRRVRQTSRTMRSLCQAWGESEALQPRRVWQSTPTRRSLYQAWCDSEVLQPRRVRQTSHTKRSLCPAWGESEALQPRRVRQSSRTRRY